MSLGPSERPDAKMVALDRLCPRCGRAGLHVFLDGYDQWLADIQYIAENLNQVLEFDEVVEHPDELPEDAVILYCNHVEDCGYTDWRETMNWDEVEVEM